MKDEIFVENEIKKQNKLLVELAKEHNIKIKTYEEFCKTPEAGEYALDEDDVKYYTERFGNGI